MDPSTWGLFRFGKKKDNWPKNEQGEPVPPVFLQHVSGLEMNSSITVNLLSAYDIPVFTSLPNDGEFGKLILGLSGTGMDIYVPETMLEDAQNILCGDILNEDAIGESEDL